MNGAGNSVREVAYDFLDAQPATGVNLYRIKQIDFDGAYSFSGIATVSIGSSNAVQASIYPNPITDDQTTLSLQGGWSIDAKATLVDFSGREITTFTNLTAGSRTLDLPEMPSGIYQLIVADQTHREVIRMVVR